MEQYRIIDLFAGIGGIRLGFEKYGAKCVFSSEWDKDAQEVYLKNFGEMPHGDINEINPEDIPDHDILLAGFPCQPFSIAGKQLGFDDTRGTLFFNIAEILRVKRPTAFLLENVKRLTTNDDGRTFTIIKNSLESLGYTIYTKVLNTLEYGGLPQKRERIYIVGFQDNIHYKFPKPLGRYKPLEEILIPDSEVPQNYFVSVAIEKRRSEMVKKIPQGASIWHENIGGNISALPYSCALRAGGSYNYLIVNGRRRLTGREMLRLQGFPDSFDIDGIRYSHLRRLAGNSVSVPVIERIAEEMFKSLTHKVPVEESVQTQIML